MGYRLRLDNQSGVLGAPLTATGTTVTFRVPPGFLTLSGGNYYAISVDPGLPSFEIVHLTGYTAGATTGTIARGQDGTTGVAHGTASPSVWDHGTTAEDLAYLPATSGLHLTTQGGSTLDDGAGNMTVGGSLSGVTAAMVGADVSGAAATSQSNAETFATSAVATETSRAETAEGLLAPKASPALTGTPTAPTASALTNNTQLATTAYADTAVGVEKTRAVAAEALLAPLASPTFTGITTAPEFTASGLAGATAASRYVGATASGAPTSGTFAVGDIVNDQTGSIWACVTAGTPGVWTDLRNPLSNGFADFLGWTFDPVAIGAGLVVPAAATVFLGRIPLPRKMSVTNITVRLITTAGSTLTNSFLALFTSAGTVVGQTADQSSAWQSGGTANVKTVALASGPFTVTPLAANDFVWSAIYIGTSAGTLPSFANAIGAGGAVNILETTARSRYASIAQANTSTLASITPGSVTPVEEAYFMGLS